MWKMFLEPEVYWPLLINLALGFTVTILTRRILWCFLGCLFIPFIVAAVYVGPHIFELWNNSEGAGSWMVEGIFLFGQGIVACGIGSLLGYYLQRFFPSRRDN
jgi:hypothetical protein